ncbi:hypothetical protein [Avibacterium paragallinarum]|uniref:hypothetical protein n=1 Tax=Avibacterium paragallinarum TaxID=728 RepID=UPI00397CAA8E
MQVDLPCLNCGSKNVRVRTSQRIGMRTIKILAICNNCGARNHVGAEILKLETPIYHERAEALRINKPLAQTDPNQQDLFEQENKT